MSFVSRMVERILKWRRFRPPKTFEERLSWLFQPYMGTLEDVILWKNPGASIGVIGAANIVFLLIWYLEIRLLGVVFGLALLCVAAEGTSAWLVKRAGHNAAARHYIIRGGIANNGAALRQAIERARQWLVGCSAYMLALREQDPPQFCLLVGLICFISALLGSVVSGVFLLYFFCMMVLIVPGLAPKTIAALKHLHPHTDSDGEVEGFMPELSPQVMAELHKAGDVPSPPSMDVDGNSDVWLPEDSINGGGDSSSDDGSNGRTLPSILDVPPDISESSSSNSSDEEFYPRNIPIKDSVRLQRHPIPTAPPETGPSSAGWSSRALGAFSSFGGVIGALLPGSSGQFPANRYSRNDSEDSDDFELIDKDNL